MREWSRKREGEEIGSDASDVLEDQIISEARRRRFTPEQQLLLRHFEQAVEDLDDPDPPTQQSARRWFRDPRWAPFSWRWTVTHLGIDVSAASPWIDKLTAADRMRERHRRHRARRSAGATMEPALRAGS